MGPSLISAFFVCCLVIVLFSLFNVLCTDMVIITLQYDVKLTSLSQSGIKVLCSCCVFNKLHSLFLLSLHHERAQWQTRLLTWKVCWMTPSWRPPGSAVPTPNRSCPTWSTPSKLSGNSWCVPPAGVCLHLGLKNVHMHDINTSAWVENWVSQNEKKNK